MFDFGAKYYMERAKHPKNAALLICPLSSADFMGKNMKCIEKFFILKRLCILLRQIKIQSGK